MERLYQSTRTYKPGTPKAVVLLSGGMDSTTCAALALHKGYEVIGLSVIYGQKHRIELQAAQKVARYLNISLYQLVLPPNTLTGSALTDPDKPLPTNRTLEEMAKSGVAPSYVPARNTILIALAAGFAEALGAEKIYYGAHREDHVGYPDTRPEFFKAMSLAVMLGTAKRIDLEAPFINATKAEIVKCAQSLNAPLELTHSCYQGHKIACGVCDTCIIRINAFKEAGLVDPIPYEIPIDWQGCKPFAQPENSSGDN